MDDVYANVELDRLGEELFDKNGKRLDGSNNKALSEKIVNEAYDENGKKIDGTYRRMESDIPVIYFYDRYKNRLKDKYPKVVIGFPDEIRDNCGKNEKKLNGIFRRIKPIEKDEKGKVGKSFSWRRNL